MTMSGLSEADHKQTLQVEDSQVIEKMDTVNGVDDTAEVESQEQELQQLKSFIAELTTRFEQKREERAKHKPNSFEYPDESFFGKLDSSIKKNSALVKKLKNMTETQKEAIMKDLASLNLSRYISEIASALVETKIKINEIPMCVKICSFLHLRYQDFTSQLLDFWVKNLPRKPNDTFNASKMRIDIRLFTELIVSGIFSPKESLPILGNLITILTVGDKENHNNLSIIVGFCRQYANELAGLVPRKMRLLSEKHNLEIPICDFLPTDKHKGVRNLIKDYYQSLVAHVMKDYKRLQKMDSEMKRFLMTRGEVSKQQKELFDSRSSDFQKLWTATQQFADLIDEDLPKLELALLAENDSPTACKGEFDFRNRFGTDQDQSNNPSQTPIWEDEETRTFYENLPDLKAIIPAILYKDDMLKDTQPNDANVDQTMTNNNNETGNDAAAAATQAKEQMIDEHEEMVDDHDDEFNDAGKDLANLNENDELEIALCAIQKTESKKADSIEDSDSTASAANNNKKETNEENIVGKSVTSSSSAQQTDKHSTANNKNSSVELFFASLQNCVNRDFIDKAALTYVTTYNTKSNRKKLVSALFTVPRTRLDLLPFYARFVAQLSPIMPSVATELVTILKHNFRYLFKKKDQTNIESKVKNVRFIGELVKFGIFPKRDVLHIIKTLLSDFRYHQIEMTCNLFETCGQYLYRSPDSYHLTNHLLNQMMQHKTRKALDTRYTIMIENAYYVVNPPEDKLFSRNGPPKTPLQQYIEHLIYTELSKSTISKVLIKLRKLNWKDSQTSAYAIKCLASVWNIKFYNIKFLAHLLVGLYSYQEWVIPRVLDTILEDIRLGLQMNAFEYNQRRMSVIKFFAECFNYRLIDSGLLFRVLYLLITYGVDYQDLTQSPLDPPSNLMRLRLVAQILHTCGSFLCSGLSRKKLDYFLHFYQRYYWLKKSYLNSLPPELVDTNAQFYIDTIFKDIINYLKPKFRLADSYESAEKQLETHLKEVAEKAKEILPNMKLSVDQILNPSKAIGKNNKSTNLLDTIEEEDAMEDDSPDDGGYEADDMDSNELADEEGEYTDIDEMEPIEDDEIKEGSESDSDEPLQIKGPTIVKCTEDDEFQRDFEKMLNESLSSRAQEVVRANVEIAIPIERDHERKKKSYFEQQPQNTAENSAGSAAAPFSMALKGHSSDRSDSFQFRVMARNAKSSKPLLKSIHVPPDSDLVRNFLAREEEARAEKEAVKKLILDINQRREQEDSGNSSSSTNNSFEATSTSVHRYNNNPNNNIGNQQQQQQHSGSYHRSNGYNNTTINYHQYRKRFN